MVTERDASVEALPYYPLAEIVYRRLLRSITAGEYPPGSSLSIATLAQGLGVSKTPVREALTRLAEVGLVINEAHRGAVVADITWEDLEAIYLMRQRLESLAAGQAARRLSPDAARDLEAAVAQLRSETAASDMAAVERTNRQIHQLIWRAAGMRKLEEVLAWLQRHVEWSRAVLLAGPSAPQDLMEQHTAIVQAVLDHDPEEAERRMRRHIARALSSLHGGA